MLADFSGREAQLNLFDECAPRPDSEALMNAVDRINRAGKGRIFLPARVSMWSSRCAGKC